MGREGGRTGTEETAALEAARMCRRQRGGTWATGDEETAMMEVHETRGETRRRRRRRRGSVCQNVNAKVPSANKAPTYPSERALSSSPFHLPIKEPQMLLCARRFAASFDDDSVLL
uniref:Uncharacterized protein n=1 Tax=Ananas comosus var. bracteatus TaxID=296719 RepID=A0A6V7NNN3_ANACO|nr:unnamed protein product [Ananas comosus var. bracteatus]